MGQQKKALVVFSGGQDSTTCLAWAKKEFSAVETITFDYGQRHKIELESAKKITKIAKVSQEVVKIDLFSKLTANALTDPSITINQGSKDQLPSTFVPGRNLIFLSIAAIYAKQRGIKDIITGVCQTDYSGYPDCRDQFIKSLEQTLNFSMDENFHLHTPLMFLSKKETVEMMQQLGQIELLKHSHTCYNGTRPACGKCPACKLRLKGFKEAGITDPLKYEQ